MEASNTIWILHIFSNKVSGRYSRFTENVISTIVENTRRQQTKQSE
jgi:hypothetical protein